MTRDEPWTCPTISGAAYETATPRGCLLHTALYTLARDFAIKLTRVGVQWPHAFEFSKRTLHVYSWLVLAFDAIILSNRIVLKRTLFSIKVKPGFRNLFGVCFIFRWLSYRIEAIKDILNICYRMDFVEGLKTFTILIIVCLYVWEISLLR